MRIHLTIPVHNEERAASKLRIEAERRQGERKPKIDFWQKR